MNEDKIRVVELFAGVGGFRLGLERASTIFDTVFASQWEPGKKVQHAYNCYISHFGDSSKHSNKDINLAKKDIPEHDLLVGGFPCQDYSVAHGNSAEGIKGKKGVLWWDILDIINAKQPSMILLENVDRLLKSPSQQRGRDFGIMLRTLDGEGYNCEWRVINAANYGLAQKRRRIFIFAYPRKNKKIFFGENDAASLVENNGFFATIFPIAATDIKKKAVNMDIRDDKYKDLVDFSDRFVTVFLNSGVMIDGHVYSCETIPECVESQTIGDIIQSDLTDSKYEINDSKEKFEKLKGSKQLARLTPDGEIYLYSEGQMSFPDSMDEPARTLLTSESSVSRTTHVILDPNTNKLRVLTPLECERLNGFNDNWTNTGMPEKFRYFCMGNALVVPLVEKMGKRIKELMEVTRYAKQSSR